MIFGLQKLFFFHPRNGYNSFLFFSFTRLENPEPAENGGEQSRLPMPYVYPGSNRVEALESTLRGEKQLIEKYELAVNLVPEGEIRNQLSAIFLFAANTFTPSRTFFKTPRKSS